MNRIALGMILILFLVGSLSLLFRIQLVRGRPITVPDEYPTIQAAINAAENGDEIFVKNGVYNESLTVDKAVLLIGENSENTVVDGRQSGDVFFVMSSGVSIINFKIMNSSIGCRGICLFGVEECLISGCNVMQNFVGIGLYFSSDNTISSNNVTNNYEGILLDYSSTENLLFDNQLINNLDAGIISYSSPSNTLKNNKVMNDVTDNFASGILILSSPNSILRNNSVSGCFSNFGVGDSGELSNFIQDIDTSNIVNGKPIYYWINKKDQKFPSDAGYVAAVNSSGIIVENLNLTNNYSGVLFVQTTNSSIVGNNITANSYGITAIYSAFNTIIGNRVAGNGYGVRLILSSDNNLLHGNTVVGNHDLYGILIDSSLNNAVCGNTVTNNQCGILIGYYSHHNVVSRNNITDNLSHGIWVDDWCNSNIVTGNNVVGNWNGIRITHFSLDNVIYHNNFIGNTMAFEVDESNNLWDNGVEGNYWSDYKIRYPNATEMDDSGIWNMSYVINANNEDKYSLMSPYIPGDYNHDGEVNMTDVDMVRASWQSVEGDLDYNPHVDFNLDGIIDIKDAAIIGVNWLKHV